MDKNCMECGSELSLTGVIHRHGSEKYHCESCHLDQVYVKDSGGPNFWDDREQHDPDDCVVCANGGPTPPSGL